MKHVLEAEIQPAPSAEVEELYFRNYGRLLDTVLEDRRLFLPDAQRIVESVARYLPAYDRELADEAFFVWFTEVTAEALEKLKWFYDLHWSCKKLIYKALWMSVGRNNEIDDHMTDEDLPVVSQTIQDLSQELWVWVIENYEKLCIPGPAKLSTRLFSRARIIAAAWRKKHHVRRGVIIRMLYGLTVEEHEQRIREAPERDIRNEADPEDDDLSEYENYVSDTFLDEPEELIVTE